MKIDFSKLIPESIVVRCFTEQQSTELLKWALSSGFSWYRGSIIDPDVDTSCGRECYLLEFKNRDVMRNSATTFKQGGWDIIDFQEIFVVDEKSSTLESEILEDRVVGLIRRTHKELNHKEDLLSTKEAAREIVKLVLGNESEQMKLKPIGDIVSSDFTKEIKTELLALDETDRQIVDLVTYSNKRAHEVPNLKESLAQFKLKVFRMNTKINEERIEVIEAFLRGETILCSKDGHHFFPDEDPTWDFLVNDYKVKES